MAAITGFMGFIGLWLMLWLPLALVVMKVLSIPWTYPIAAEHKLPLLLPLYGVAPLAVWGYSHDLTDQVWANYGLVWATLFWRQLGVGFALAVVGVVLLVAVELGLGWRQPQISESLGGNRALVVAGVLTLTSFIGGIEELIFRGVLVESLLATVAPWAMVTLASLIFALSHLLWDGPAGIPSLPGLGLMGAVLILARWIDGGSLALPWGLHSGWIFAIALLDSLQLFPPATPLNHPLAGKPEQPLTGLPALGLLALTGLGLWSCRFLF
jgi:hypothetical protein